MKLTPEQVLEAITREVVDHSDPEYPVRDTVLSLKKLADFLSEHIQ